MRRFGCSSESDKNEKRKPKEDVAKLLETISSLENKNSFLASKLEHSEVKAGLDMFTGSVNEKTLLSQISALKGINETLQNHVNTIEKDGELLLQNSTFYHTQNRMYENKFREMEDAFDKLEFEHQKLKLEIENRKDVEVRLEEKKDGITQSDERLKLVEEIERKEKEIALLENAKSFPALSAEETTILPVTNPKFERTKVKSETDNSVEVKKKTQKKASEKRCWKN